MAKIVIAGDAAVITSSAKLEDIKTLEKYRPKALTLTETNDDGKKEVAFRVGTTAGAGDISKFGISFGSASHDENKLATLTIGIPSNVEDAKEYAAEHFGYAVMLLNQVEDGFEEALADVKTEKEKVMSNISLA